VKTLKIQEIRELIKLVDQSAIDEFEYEQDGAKVTMKKSQVVSDQLTSTPSYEEKAIFSEPAEVPAKKFQTEEKKQVDGKNDDALAKTGEQESDENVHKIESPMVGTFYSSPSPEAGPYVKTGDRVDQSKVVCIVEAMKLFNEIEAEIEGEIVEVLAENGELVEYGQPLFLVKPE
jgi:acetyl-CoA carboxylase biotin carboxyl carrier protein